MDEQDWRVRPGSERDAAAISALTLDLAKATLFDDCTPEGAARLCEAMLPAPTAARLHEGYRYWVAEHGGEVIGVIALRSPSHLYHLFVAQAWQRHGVARALWNALRDHVLSADASARVTVNASRGAVTAYFRMGFVSDGPERCDYGVPAQPMHWSST